MRRRVVSLLADRCGSEVESELRDERENVGSEGSFSDSASE